MVRARLGDATERLRNANLGKIAEKVTKCFHGFVRTDEVIGKPLMIYDSIAERTLVRERIPFGNTRWTRLFKFL
jgi:hypothetical protein